MDEKLVIAGREFASRLMVGTGKYPDMATMQEAIAVAETEIVTVAIRRLPLEGGGENLLDYLDRERITLLPNTAGATTAEEAVRLARLGRAAGLSNFVKLEVIGDSQTLYPDPVATLEATRILVRDGFDVLVYTSQDPVLARYLEEAGAAAVMPYGSAIGSGQGILDFTSVRMIVDRLSVPVVVDAGLGAPSDAALAMEAGADAVLINTGIACARDPVLMAKAMRSGVQAGRYAYLAGRIPRQAYASASSPTKGLPGQPG